MQRKHILQTINKLRAYRNVSFPIISVYLNNKNCACGGKLAEDFRRQLQQTAVASEERQLKKEIQTIEAYLSQDYDIRKHCKGIAIFAGEKLWEIIHYDFSIPTQMTITHHPYIAPLLQELYNQGEDLVVIADKRKAKLFLFHNGIVTKQQEIINDVVRQKIKANKGENYARNSKIMHTISDQIRAHVRLISEKINAFVKKEQIHAIFFGGSKPFIQTLEKHLQVNVRKKIRGEFIVSVKAAQNELLRKSKHAIAHAATLS